MLNAIQLDDRSDLGREMPKGRSGVARVEGGLIPALAEPDTIVIVRAVALTFPGVRVFAQVVSVIEHLKHTVMRHDPMDLFSYIWLENCRRKI